jgi:hypothetical protein
VPGKPEGAPLPASPLLLCAAAWLVPGAGHMWLGRPRKGVVFLVVLLLMFGVGLGLEGRLFPFQLDQPLVALEALAELGLALPYVAARLAGAGAGRVVAMTYEYGNAFLIVAGILNLLVVLDVFDIARGRK